jgi:threonine/homoserine/homoserine lactone efflux protein
MWGYLIQGFGYGFAAAVQPGPFQTYVISQTLNRGWRRTLPAALAPLVSDGPIILLVLFVLRQIPDWLQQALYLAGGLFVLYLAWGAFRSWRDYQPTWEESELPEQQGLLKAALANALSPGPYLYWSLVTGPILLAGWREQPARGIAFLAGFYLSIVFSLVALILLFGHARHLGPRVNRALLAISALALAGFGLYQLCLGVTG